MFKHLFYEPLSQNNYTEERFQQDNIEEFY